MLGSSREALVAGRTVLRQQLSAGADPTGLGNELFAVTNLLDDSHSLRRALADPTREETGKQQLADGLLRGKVSDATIAVVNSLVGSRWSTENDLVDGAEQLAVEALLVGADRDGALDRVEDELFRVERVVSGSPDLQNALSDPQRSAADKAGLMRGLLEGKTAPQTIELVSQAVSHPRGQRLVRVLTGYGTIAARLREQLTATVTSAFPLDEALQQRVSQALAQMYGRPVRVDLVVDPSVVGGLRIQVGDEIIDGTILSRLSQAQRLLAG
ncbi:F0F1 ATP synthase subunit delta [Branchiibius sp. NY16-3462-2]|uniref:F0F1 ATP synthase subunit delta n=1 Tax=Branchiibius sp. NY16-3462-2 TaxID=1807500 RepID=UPI00079B4FDB|nr:F0F1 ATP synthase subunit delta [Branchiibius sp. NY16-3462-2]KYH45823.1 hypothetical protein AZH51_09035 [Branchiibius sp. NY16-3462-2]